MTTPIVSEYMVREVVYLRRGDTVLHAREVMALGDLRHLPIVDEAHHVVGIISDRDVLAALSTGEQNTVVGDVMTHPVHTVTATTPAHVAVARLLYEKIGALAVVSDEDPRLVGIVTETDFLVVAQRALGGEAP